MKDPTGKRIGAWYSILSIKTMVIKMGKDNEVVVYTPELIIYPGDGGGEGIRGLRIR
jgi:hypothetical protein